MYGISSRYGLTTIFSENIHFKPIYNIHNRFLLHTCSLFKISRCGFAQACFPRILTGDFIKKRMCIKPVFWPPKKPKIKSYLTALSLDCFIRWNIKVFLFHIDWTLSEVESGDLTGKLR